MIPALEEDNDAESDSDEEDELPVVEEDDVVLVNISADQANEVADLIILDVSSIELMGPAGDFRNTQLMSTLEMDFLDFIKEDEGIQGTFY